MTAREVLGVGPTAFMEGDVVEYKHPDWGRVRGRVLLVVIDRESGEMKALCQDLSQNGGREHWPAAELRRAM